MTDRQVEWAWLDARETVTVAELSQVCGISQDELDELVEIGALAPLEQALPARVFGADCVMPLRAAARLREDFDLDLFTLGLLLDQLRRIEALERELRTLRALLPGHAA